MIKKFFLYIFLGIFLCMMGGCKEWPRDPRHTLEKVQHSGIIRVGVIENPPWSSYIGREYKGVEVALIEKFSRELKVTPIWFSFSEANGISALRNEQIDLLIGGFTETSPWKKEIGSVDYFTAKYYIARPKNLSKRSIKNLPISTKKMSFLVPILKKESAIPLEMDNPFFYTGEIAAAEWEFDLQKYILDQKIYQDKHIIAFLEGENLFMTRLERFLNDQQDKVGHMLREETIYENRFKKGIRC